MRQALTGARIFDGARLLDGHAVVIDDGIVSAVVPESDVPRADRQPIEGLLAPGFIDIQVNGGGGVLFNDAPTVEGIAAIGAAHRKFGTTSFLPTLISDRRARIAEAMAAARAAIAAGVRGVLGVHIEGPFIAPERKGAHDPAMVRLMEPADVDLLAEPVGGKTLVTVAPEVVPPALIQALAAAGVVVSAGHTAADVETIVKARAAGLTLFTHLFNAMPPLAGRAPGPVGAALDDPDCWASLIVDLRHVSPTSLRVALAAKGWQRMILVSDAMPTVGANIAGFQLGGQRVTLADGRLTLPDGTLAGSNLDMATAVRNAVRVLGLPVEAALHMASRAPAECLGIGDRYGRIASGYRADFVLLDDDLGVTRTWIGGVAPD